MQSFVLSYDEATKKFPLTKHAVTVVRSDMAAEPDVMDSLRAIASRKPNARPSEVSKTTNELFDMFEAMAYNQTTVLNASEAILNGHGTAAHYGDKIDRIRQNLTSVRHVKSQFAHLSTIVWASIGQALSDPEKPQAVVDELHGLYKYLRIQGDHPLHTALSETLDVMSKASRGQDVSPLAYSKIAEAANQPTPANFKSTAIDKSANTNFSIMVEQIASRFIATAEKNDRKTATAYANLFVALNVEVEVLEPEIQPSTQTDTDDDSTSASNQYPAPPTINMEDSGDGKKVTIVMGQKNKHLGMFLTGGLAAAVIAGSTQVTSNPEGQADSKSPETSATSPQTVEPSTPIESANTTEPGHGAQLDAANGGQAVLTDIGASPLDSPFTPPQIKDGFAGTSEQTPDTAPEASITKPPKDLPTLPNTSGSEGYEVALNGPRAVQSQNELLIQAIVRGGTLSEATGALKSKYLALHPNTPANDAPRLISSIIEYTEQTDKEVVEARDNQKISVGNYDSYRKLSALGRLFGQYPDLSKKVQLHRGLLVETEFTGLFAEYLVETKLISGTNTLSEEQLSTLTKVLASAAEYGWSEQAKQAFVEEHAPPEPIITPPEPKTPQAESNTNDNSQEALETKDKITLEVLNRMENDGPLWKDRAIALRGLMARGYSLEVASGFVGNAIVESHKIGEPYGAINWDIEQYGGGPGRGGWQWGSFEPAYDRFGHGGVGKEGTLRWYAAQHDLNWWDPEAQLGFIDYELRHAEGAAAEKLRAAKTAVEASNIVLYDFERPAAPAESQERRAQHAQATATRFNVIRQNILNEQSMNNAEAPGNPNDSFFELNADIMKYLHDKYGLESGHLKPSDLERLGDTWGDAQLYPDASKTFRIMSEAFETEFGRPLEMSSPGAANAYRSYEEQKRLKDEKPYLAATPGTSNHGWGLSIDLGGGVNHGPGSPEYEWLVANANKYGWGQEDFAKPNGSKPEAWHWTYMGGKKVVSVPGVHQGSPENTGERIPVPVSVRGYAHPVDPGLVHNLGTLYDGYTSMAGFHPGWDYEVPTGTRVYPVKPGVITEVGFEDDSDGLDGDGAGNYIEIRHYDGTYSDYQHLSAENVAVGQTVDFGEVIGRSGNTGNSMGEHLHITLREKGVDDFVSRLDADVEAKTINPATVMPALRVVNNWLEENGHQRVEAGVGRLAVEATETHDEGGEGESAQSELEIRLGSLTINPPQPEQNGHDQTSGIPNSQQNPWANAHNGSNGQNHR